jgi:hypothetical protein
MKNLHLQHNGIMREEEQAPDPIVYGFPRSTYVNIVRLVLTHVARAKP